MTEPIKDGGPAFPVPLNPGEPWQGMAPCDGMTLRDYFAAKAMQGWQANPNPNDTPINDVAQWSYRMADAMLRARSQGEPDAS
ncbi:hypothetical protein DUD43_07255 [Alcaligenes faecalis]|uniref:hypothetical protein n=1 Tax=Alcaligenes faecalis TaxID=511 RepID=UPI001293F893|nr:hypothetical protein [Alcaligenes faecalis]QFY77498.1 hypothetical protein DUD43_07255 [Alcaligenes faecalis]